MAAEDELAKRRYERLLGRVGALMRASLKPEYQGYGGQVVLSVDAVEELSADPAEIRRAARAVGRRLGWKTVTREIDGRIFVVDDREPPEAVRELMQQRAADALDAVLSPSLSATRQTVGELRPARVRYLADPFLLGALRRGKRVEQFLGPVGGGEVPGVRYVEVRPAGQNFEVVLHTVKDVGHATFMDLVEFPALNSEDDEEEFGRVIATADDPPTALATAERLTGAVRERWVNEGIAQAEYADFVQAGRPSDSSPDGHPWPAVPTGG